MERLVFYLTFALYLVSVQAHDESTGSLLTVLRANKLNAYADHLEFEAPDTLAKFEEQEDLTLLAPSSIEFPEIFTIPAGRRLTRRQSNNTDDEPEEPEEEPKKFDKDDYSQGFTSEGSLAVRLFRRHNETGIPPSNYQVRRTLLKNATVANIGADEPLKYVTNYYDSGSAGAQLHIETGFGMKVNTTAGPFKYNSGIIYAADSWNVHPGSLTETLSYLSLSDAVSEINSAGQKSNLESTPSITYFAYTDASTTRPSVADCLISNMVAYSPLLESGQTYTASSGAPLVISREGETVYVNGHKVVRPNVPIQNGVVHFVQSGADVQQPVVQPEIDSAGAKVGVICASMAVVLGAAVWVAM